MNQPFTTKLSQELIDEIVDHLSYSKLDLDACSKSHRVFLHRCQKHLFSVLYFASDRSRLSSALPAGYQHSARQDRMSRLLEIFQQSPHIARSVHGLHLDISSIDNEWVADDSDFNRIMEIITQSGSKIKYLKLRGCEFPEKLSNARSLEQNFLLPFISATLTTLHVSRILDLPMSLIANSANLKHLRIHYTAPELYHGGVDENLLKAFPNIQTLEIRPPDAMIGLLLGHDGFPNTRSATVQEVMTFCGIDYPAVADITSLKTFRTFNTPYYLTIAQAIMDKAKVTLEEFYLRGDSEEGQGIAFNLTNSVNLGELSRLQRLYMDIVIPLSFNVNAIQDLSSVLLTIPDNNSLQIIGLQIFNGQYDRRSVPESIYSPSWSLLDDQVARIAGGRPFTFQLHICHQPAEFSDSESDSDSSERRTVTRNRSSQYDEPESSIRLRACRSEREHEALLHNMCKSVYRMLLFENMPKIMQSPNITVVSTYSIRTPYHYWAPRGKHVKNIL